MKHSVPSPALAADAAARDRLVGSFFWRRIDRPGHDGCRLLRRADGGWRLSGMAAFREAGRSCHLAYEVAADDHWRTQHAAVTGWIGRRAVDLRILRTAAGRWKANGGFVETGDAQRWRQASDDPTDRNGLHDLGDAVAGCLDVDLAFTPATNLLAIRRLALRTGQRAEAPAVWLALPALRWVPLGQAYRRLSRTAYAYESPQVGYAGTLRVGASGGVIDYPGLFISATTRLDGRSGSGA